MGKKSPDKKNKQHKQNPPKKGHVYRETTGYIKALFWALIIAFLVKSSIAEPYRIPSSSMEDTLLIGDFIISNKMIYGSKIPFTGIRLPAIRHPQQGDVITFKFPLDRRTDYVKRCVAVEGQKVEVIDKVLYVDGEPYPDPEYAKYEDSTAIARGNHAVRDNFGPRIIPRGYVFAMGDNRDRSYDSRFWGPLPIELIEGKVEIIQWSIAPDTTAPQIDMTNMASIPSAVVHTAWNFFGSFRWDRTFKRVR